MSHQPLQELWFLASASFVCFFFFFVNSVPHCLALVMIIMFAVFSTGSELHCHSRHLNMTVLISKYSN